ncbi:MAG: thioredoxin family protein [Planctomycetota bacterium]|nr:MAG: thioredoxin family protein [Planctomycetota bacterium]
MKIEILGTGCAKCAALAELAERAAAELELDCEVEKVTELDRILDRGVMITPALAVDGEVLVAGSVPALEELKERLGGRS